MKGVRYWIYAIVGLLVLLVLGGAIFAMTFDPNRYKGQIETLVKDKTGRTLSLKGNLELAFWPALGAKVNGVTLSERASDQQFVALDSAHASVALLPLLHGQAIVDGIRVSGLKANIVKEKDGRFNFSDLMEAQPADGKAPASKDKPAEKKAQERADAGGKAVAFDIASVQVDRSSVSYLDQASGQELAVSDLKLSTGRIAEKADGKLELKAAIKGRNPDLDVKVDVGGGYKFDLGAKSFAISKLDAKLTGAAAGFTNLNVSAKGDVAANPEKNEYQVNGLALDVKGVQDKQNLEAHIAAPELVIAADKAKGAAVTADLKLKEAAREIEAKLKLSGVEGSAKALVIPQLTADVAMNDPSLPQKSVKIPITGSLKADLDKQTANADLSAKFDESNIQAKLGLAKFSPPAYQFDINVDRLNLDRYSQPEKKPVSAPQAPSQKGAQKDTLEGRGTLALDVNAAGKTVNTMKKSLAGTARLQLKDGAIKGINLAEVFRKAKSALGSQEARTEARQTQQTDFSEMTASFTIKNGVAHNEDLDMKAPLFRVSGRGDIDIGNSSLDYVTKATVVATAKGQGGDDLSQLAGLTVPVHLSGPFDALKYQVDYSAAASELAKSKLGDKLKERLQERLGGGKPPAEGSPAQGGSPPQGRGSTADKLRGLLGR